MCGHISHWKACVLAALAFAITPIVMTDTAEASGGGGKWLRQQLIGVKSGSWVTIQTEVHYQSYYRYETKAELRVTSAQNGCVLQRANLGKFASLDFSANGNWKRKTLSKRDDDAMQLRRDALPVTAAFDRDELSIRAGAVALKYGERFYTIISKSRVKQWAQLLGFELSEEIRLVDVQSPAVYVGGVLLSYLELETLHRNIDQDYIRFIIPIDVGGARRLIDKGIAKPKLLMATQPNPKGC